MAKSKNLLSSLTSDVEAQVFVTYNVNLVNVLISMLSQDETSSTCLELQLAYQFLVGLLSTGGDRMALEDEHVWQLKVYLW
jgi:hypothetical protein